MFRSPYATQFTRQQMDGEASPEINMENRKAPSRHKAPQAATNPRAAARLGVRQQFTKNFGGDASSGGRTPKHHRQMPGSLNGQKYGFAKISGGR